MTRGNLLFASHLHSDVVASSLGPCNSLRLTAGSYRNQVMLSQLWFGILGLADTDTISTLF